jgi:hypothetical protein
VSRIGHPIGNAFGSRLAGLRTGYHMLGMIEGCCDGEVEGCEGRLGWLDWREEGGSGVADLQVNEKREAKGEASMCQMP